MKIMEAINPKPKPILAQKEYVDNDRVGIPSKVSYLTSNFVGTSGWIVNAVQISFSRSK